MSWITHLVAAKYRGPLVIGIPQVVENRGGQSFGEEQASSDSPGLLPPSVQDEALDIVRQIADALEAALLIAQRLNGVQL